MIETLEQCKGYVVGEIPERSKLLCLGLLKVKVNPHPMNFSELTCDHVSDPESPSPQGFGSKYVRAIFTCFVD